MSRVTIRSAAALVLLVALISAALTPVTAMTPSEALAFKSKLTQLFGAKSVTAVDTELAAVARSAIAELKLGGFDALAAAEKKTPDALWAELMPGVARSSVAPEREALVTLAGLAQAGRALPRHEIDAIGWAVKEKLAAGMTLTAEERTFIKTITTKLSGSRSGKYVLEGEQFVFKGPATTTMVKFITPSKKQLSDAYERELARLRTMLARHVEEVPSKVTYGATALVGETTRRELVSSLKDTYTRQLNTVKGWTPEQFAAARSLPAVAPLKVLNPNPSAADLQAAREFLAAERATLLKREAEIMADFDRWSIAAFCYDADARAARAYQQGNVARHQLVNLVPSESVNEAAMQAGATGSALGAVRKQLAVQDRLTVEQVAQTRLPISVSGAIKPVVEASKLVADDAIAVARKFNTKSFAASAEEMRQYINPRDFPDAKVNGLSEAQYIAKLESGVASDYASLSGEAKRVVQYSKELAAAMSEAEARRIAKLIEESRDKIRALDSKLQDAMAESKSGEMRMAYRAARKEAAKMQNAEVRAVRDELAKRIHSAQANLALTRDERSTLAWLRSAKPADGHPWNIRGIADPAGELARLEAKERGATGTARAKLLEEAQTFNRNDYEKDPLFASNAQWVRQQVIDKTKRFLEALAK